MDLIGFNYYNSLNNDYGALEYLLNNLSRVEKDFGAFFGHFTFSHDPIAHDENCYFSYKKKIKNEAQLNGQVTCILKTMAKIIKELKRKNLYESSLIVFKSDHGKPSDYFNKKTVRGINIFHEGNIFGYDRYRPFVMLKLPHQKSDKINFNKKMFHLSDLSKIYCESYRYFSFLPVHNCDALQKFLAEEYRLDSDGSYYLYVPKNINTFSFDGHDAVKNANSIKEMEIMFKKWSFD